MRVRTEEEEKRQEAGEGLEEMKTETGEKKIMTGSRKEGGRKERRHSRREGGRRNKTGRKRSVKRWVSGDPTAIRVCEWEGNWFLEVQPSEIIL